MFNINQHVVCIDDQIPAVWQKLLAPLMEGSTYTIRDVVRGTRGNPEEEEVAVYLVEITNPSNPHGIEYGYNAERFAPLEEVDTKEEIEEVVTCTPGKEVYQDA